MSAARFRTPARPVRPRHSPPFAVYPWLEGDHLGHYRRYASAADLSGFVLYPRWILCDGSLLPLVADMQRHYTQRVAPGRPTFQWIRRRRKTTLPAAERGRRR